LLERRPDDPFSNDYIVTIPIAPEGKRLGVCFPVEGNRWIVTLGSFFGDTAPTDDAGYLAFAETLANDDIAQLLRVASPASDLVTHKLNSSRRRQVHKLTDPPAGYAMLGDTIASFNPIYGQGMSSASLQAMALAKILDDAGGAACDRSVVRRFYKQAAKVVNNPWQITAGGDFSYPETAGKKAPGTDAINRYITKVQRATHTSPEVTDAMLAVQNLVAPPPSLMKPAMMRKVLRAAKQTAPATAERTNVPV
jgi:2-polyprenyl-6-methoxyphenol hydroxylase-like FAD-dependent oxidoreductase